MVIVNHCIKVNAKNGVKHNVLNSYKLRMFQFQGLCQLWSQPGILCVVKYYGKTVHGAKFMTMTKNWVRNVKTKLL